MDLTGYLAATAALDCCGSRDLVSPIALLTLLMASPSYLPVAAVIVQRIGASGANSIAIHHTSPAGVVSLWVRSRRPAREAHDR